MDKIVSHNPHLEIVPAPLGSAGDRLVWLSPVEPILLSLTILLSLFNDNLAVGLCNTDIVQTEKLRSPMILRYSTFGEVVFCICDIT